MVQTVEKTPDVHIVRRRFTPEEYHRMAEIGLFDGERVELIEGEVVKMSPIGPAHTVCTHRVFLCLQQLLGDAFFVRMQSPLSLGESGG